MKKIFSNTITLLLICIANSILAQTSKPNTYSWTNLPKVAQPVFKKDTLSIASFGAIGDGLILNTKSINEAIATCSKKGGGVVLIPGGFWLTGPIELKSNVNLHVVREALLQFTGDFNQYPLVEGSYEGQRSARNQSPLYATGAVNIAITGKGIIDGNGDAWRMVGKDRLTEEEWKRKIASGGMVSDDGKTWFPSAKTRLAHETKRTSHLLPGQTLKDFESIKDYLRPNLLVFTNCKKVLLEGVTFQNSPAWCLHPLMCEDLTVRNVFVKNPDYAQNGDGIDVESCKNVLIEGSIFDVGDDGICIKSGKDEEGRKRGIPTENVVVRNNVVYKGHGGFVIGSEMSGGARNIFVYDCSFIGTDNGLRFKTVRGRGGVVENIYIRNIQMKDILRDAILFDMYYFTKPPSADARMEVPAVTETTPVFQHFYISNIVCNGAARGIFIRGLPEMNVQSVFINDLVLKANKAVEIIEGTDIHLNNVQMLSEQTKPMIYIENSKDVVFSNIKCDVDVELLFSLHGARSKQIHLENTTLSNVKKDVEFIDGAKAAMFTVN